MAKKKTIKSPWSRVVQRLRSGRLAKRPLMGRPKQINPKLPSRRTRNLNPVAYATLQRIMKAGSRSAKPFSKRMPRMQKKVNAYGTGRQV